MRWIILYFTFTFALISQLTGQTEYITIGSDLISGQTHNCGLKYDGKFGSYVDIAITPDGRIYGVGISLTNPIAGIYLLDTINKTETLVCIPSDGTNEIMGVGLVALDNNYLLTDGGNELYKFEIATGIATKLGYIGYYCNGDFAFLDGILYMSNIENELIKIVLDPVTKNIVQVSNQGQMTTNYTIYGLFSTYQNCNSNTRSLFAIENNLIYEVNVNDASVILRCSLPSTFGAWGAASRYDFQEVGYPKLLPNDTTLCNTGGGFNIQLQPYYGLQSYVWNNQSTSSSLTVNQSGTYWLTASTSCGTITDTIHVTFMNAPINDLGNDTTICSGSSLKLSAIDTAGTQYLWSDLSTNRDLTVNTAGTYWLRVSNGSCSVSDSIVITVQDLPAVDLGPDFTICMGDTFQLLPISLTGSNLQWQNGSSASVYQGSSSGSYWLEVSNVCGTARDSIQVTLNDLSFSLGPDTTVCDFVPFQIQADQSGMNYLWSDQTTSPQIEVSESGSYWLQISSGQCSYTDSIQVTFESCPVIVSFPDVFSPNDDGINDFFQISSVFGIQSFELIILNRWGNLIYKSNDPSQAWNGCTVSGEPVSEGVYFWLITYSDLNDKSYQRQGYTHLIRK